MWSRMNQPIRDTRGLREQSIFHLREEKTEAQRGRSTWGQRSLRSGDRHWLQGTSSLQVTAHLVWSQVKRLSSLEKPCRGQRLLPPAALTCCVLSHLIPFYTHRRILSGSETMSRVAKAHTDMIPVWWGNFCNPRTWEAEAGGLYIRG